ncbi:MAG TPA: BlaI/MecI/CopY family transcriptional regulator [Puia sp.]
MGTTKYIKPTESELEILRILWERNTASVREVHEELSKTKEAGYTTTLKLMQIMNEKGLVGRDDSVKTHIYHPVVSREKTQKHLIGKMISTLFGGSSTELVLHALGNHKASPEELEEIQLLLNNLKKQ